MTTSRLLGGLSLGALVLAAYGAAPTPPAPAPAAAAAQLKLATAEELGGKDRYLSYLSTDKPIYRANEKVFVRSIILNAATHQPLGDNVGAMAMVQILGPKGDVVANGNSNVTDSVAGFNWTVPPTAAGGEYTLKVEYPNQGYAPSERKFDVRIYRAPRLRSQVNFVREGYGPGDKVLASVHSERAEGGFPADAKVTVTARVDGIQVFVGQAKIDAKGDASTSFDLPKTMEKGDGTLAFAIEDGGTVETAAKTIPILLQSLDVAFYPEGGDAIAGVENRIYLEAKTPNQKPADLVGQILDSKGTKVADVKTEHEGRGRFSFTPKAGEKYVLKITEPSSIAKTIPLPTVKESGVVIHAASDTVGKDKNIGLTFAVSTAGKYKVTLSKREQQVANPPVFTMGAGHSQELEMVADAALDGVLTLTVWDEEKGIPLAERLIYRQPAHQINVTVKSDQSTYTPGGKVKLDVITTDESGKPIAAMVGLTATDDTVQEMVEKREQAPRLPVMVMLESEVKELADAQIYMDASNPKSALATDLLLGTQGWRRFATVNATEFLSKDKDSAKRVLAYVKPAPPPMDVMMFANGGQVAGAGGVRRMAMNGAAADGARPMPMPVAPQAAPAAVMEDREVAGVIQDKAMVVNDLKAAHEMPAEQLNQDAMQKKVADIAPMPMQPADQAGLAAGRPARGGGGGRGPAVAGGAMRIRPGGGGQFAQGGPSDMVVVREFAHELRPNWSPTDRSDFTETVYWSAAIKTDSTGHGAATFSLADSVTTFRMIADSFSKDGLLGTSSSTLQAVQPFYIEPKLPLEVTAGDVIELPISAINNTAAALDKFAVTFKAPEGVKITAPSNAPATLAASERSRQLFRINVDKPSDVDLTINAAGGAYSDNVTRKLRVVPTGFPTQIAYGGLLDSANKAAKEFVVPASVVPGSMKTEITVYSSPMANLTDAVASLIRQPNGCFEQTSSSNYPLAMAQMYFLNHQGVDPKLISESKVLLDQGYQHLVGFECKDKGYEWFGGATPGHEALTAYGLMEFHDMQQAHVDIVDPQMVERTRVWLLDRRDGQGGFQRNAKSLDSFGGAPELTTNTYIVWALLQAGEKNLDKEVTAVREAAKKSDDSYVLALAANICELGNDSESARFFMDKLAKKQNKEGGVDGAVTSITRSGGQALTIEATSLASLAWIQDKTYAAQAQNSIKFLADSCKGGRFGSTQSTILALKAITAYDTANAHPKAAGEVVLLVDGQAQGEAVKFTADTKEPLKFTDIAAALQPGQHTVALAMTDGSQMPFSIAINYNSVTPSTDAQCKLELDTGLKDAQVIEGNVTESRVIVTNKTDKDAASPIAIIGIPGGLEVRHDQLKELVKSGKIDAYEVRGREVVLYWRQIKAGAKADLAISLTAAVPGTYTAPASRAYEYYTDEFKQWNPGEVVTITAKK